MKNVLLTGAGPRSFIGRNLRELLAAEYNIFAPPHAELELLDYDALERYILAHRIDAIVHGAVHVPMFNGPKREFYNDMHMFMNMEKAAQHVEKLVYFGSGAEYDKRFDITMVTEENIGKSIPESEYGLAKYTMNSIARSSQKIYNLRLFGVFGKYELWELKFISNLCCKALYGLPLTIRRDCLFDFLYIDDLARVVDWALKTTPAQHDYNVCFGTPYSLTDLANMVKEISGTSANIIVLEEGRNLDYTASNTALRRDFAGFKPTPMHNAIEALYAYYEQHKTEISLDVLKETK
jgi:GDP-L-fucose synthase